MGYPAFLSAPPANPIKIDGGIQYYYVVPVKDETSITVEPIDGFEFSVDDKVVHFKFTAGNNLNRSYQLKIHAINSTGSVVQSVNIQVVSRQGVCDFVNPVKAVNGEAAIRWGRGDRDYIVGDWLRVDRTIKFFPLVSGTTDPDLDGQTLWVKSISQYRFKVAATMGGAAITPDASGVYNVAPAVAMNGSSIIHIGAGYPKFTVGKKVTLTYSDGTALPAALVGQKFVKTVLDASHVELSNTLGGAAIVSGADSFPATQDVTLLAEWDRNYPSIVAGNPTRSFTIDAPPDSFDLDPPADLNLDAFSAVGLPAGVTVTGGTAGAAGTVTIDVEEDEVLAGTTKIFPIILIANYHGNEYRRFFLLSVTRAPITTPPPPPPLPPAPFPGGTPPSPVPSALAPDAIVDVAARKLYRPGGPAGRADRMEHTLGDPYIFLAFESLGADFIFPVGATISYGIWKNLTDPAALAYGETELDAIASSTQIGIDLNSADLIAELAGKDYADLKGVIGWRFASDPDGYWNRTPAFPVRVYNLPASTATAGTGTFVQVGLLTMAQLAARATTGLEYDKWEAQVTRTVAGVKITTGWTWVAWDTVTTAADEPTSYDRGILISTDFDDPDNPGMWIKTSG